MAGVARVLLDEVHEHVADGHRAVVVRHLADEVRVGDGTSNELGGTERVASCPASREPISEEEARRGWPDAFE